MNRYEYKFLISKAQARELALRLEGAFARDPHGDEYFIRSLYFDDVNFSAYHDKIGGVKNRVKYRLRFYNMDDSYITLEAKRKTGKTVSKTSFVLTRDDAQSLIDRDFGVLKNYSDALAQEFYAAAAKRTFAPAAVTDYSREAFVHPASDMRITFDKNLSTISDFNIFEEGLKKHVYDSHSTVLEVKYSEVLPDMAKNLIPFIGQSEAISKYCLCLEKGRLLRGH
jgi:SPX domain protein involved in polyphosphate accumulation